MDFSVPSTAQGHIRTNRQTDRQTETQRERQTETVRQRQTDRDTEREREREWWFSSTDKRKNARESESFYDAIDPDS